MDFNFKITYINQSGSSKNTGKLKTDIDDPNDHDELRAALQLSITEPIDNEDKFKNIIEKELFNNLDYFLEKKGVQKQTENIKDISMFFRIITDIIQMTIVRSIKNILDKTNYKFNNEFVDNDKIQKFKNIISDNSIIGFIKNDIVSDIKKFIIDIDPEPYNATHNIVFINKVKIPLIKSIIYNLYNNIMVFINTYDEDKINLLMKKIYIINWSTHKIEIKAENSRNNNKWICPTVIDKSTEEDVIEQFKEINWFEKNNPQVIFDSGNSLPTIVNHKFIKIFSSLNKIEYIHRELDIRFIADLIFILNQKDILIHDYKILIGLTKNKYDQLTSDANKIDFIKSYKISDQDIFLLASLFYKENNLFHLFLEDHLDDLIFLFSELLGDKIGEDIDLIKDINDIKLDNLLNQNQLKDEANNYKLFKIYNGTDLEGEVSHIRISQFNRKSRRKKYVNLTDIPKNIKDNFLGYLASKLGWKVGQGAGGGLVISSLIVNFEFRMQKRDTTLNTFRVKALIKEGMGNILFGEDVIAKLSKEGIYLGINDETLNKIPELWQKDKAEMSKYELEQIDFLKNQILMDMPKLARARSL
jgi:hypothetical protein